MNDRRAGIIYLNIDGVLQEAKGDFTYNLGNPKKDAIIGSTKVNGYKEVVQVAFIEGAITDAYSLDLNALSTLEGVDITLELANGKVIQLSKAWYAGEGSVTTAEGDIAIRFESSARAQEIK